MTRNHTLGLSIFASIVLTACSSGSDIGVSSGSKRGPQPETATWRCEDGTQMFIYNAGDRVDVETDRMDTYSLPVDPPGQFDRFGTSTSAIVFDGAKASWFASGRAPTDCTRSP